MTTEARIDREWRMLKTAIRGDPAHWLNDRLRLDELGEATPQFRWDVVLLIARAVKPGVTFAEKVSYRRPAVDGWLIQDLDDVVASERARQLADLAPDARTPDEGSEVEHRGLTRTQILRAKAAHYADGHKSMPIHERCGVSKSTLRRARIDHDLMPWPTD